jgi:hypothetical protein
MELTPYELWRALTDKAEFEEYKIKPVAEAIRMSTLWLVNLKLPRGRKIKKVTKIMEFVWDKKTVNKKPQTLKHMKRVMGMIAGGDKLSQSDMLAKRASRQRVRDIYNDKLKVALARKKAAKARRTEKQYKQLLEKQNKQL